VSTDDEIRTDLRAVGIEHPTDDEVLAVRRLSEAGVMSQPVAAVVIGKGLEAVERPRRRGLFRRWLDSLNREQLERERYLFGSDDVREAFLAGHAAGMRDATLLRW
jgi:hypothetical protein